VFASDEKADWNCLFKILAFSVGSACNKTILPWVTPQIKKLINKKN
jgi:hypothetical protein